MDPNVNSAEAELESFRQKWREEVSAKAKGKQAQPSSSSARPAPTNTATTKTTPTALHARQKSEEIDEVQPYIHHDLGEKQHGRRLDESSPPEPSSSLNEPRSALEHYEKAVERETQGSLGDSLNLYRKAFKLDDKVHETYKAKHFPPSYFKANPPPRPSSQYHHPEPPVSKPPIPHPNPSNASPTVPNPAHHSLNGLPRPLQSLISTFSSLSIQASDPPTEFSPPPPCPISTIPEEILTEILSHLAILDIASFARLAQVCKRLAYLVTTEDSVWKRVALGHEYGFPAMHYKFACKIDGKPLGTSSDGNGGYLLGTSDLSLATPPPPSQTLITTSLVPSPYPTFLTLFKQRPRLRFNGCYISTVNYTRPGAASVAQLTWNSPIHIVTYYRYLRFLRNGSCISLLTTSEPADVVPYLHPEYVHRNHGALPSAPMKDAVKGRWRLSGSAENEKEGLVIIEKAGVTPKYMDKMLLSMGHAGRGARNNKLSWEGYWSYNRLTDDWAEFGLKNDRAFYWSRVKSYGMGLEDED
ncbi:hypothetical protein P280DRAFT_413500 [Massarina eburnea CBS 473.64]|uniref:F-box domain-containing protein n=1 Tax=Massarina eburnea CBS 473.64 TaxID=1395130 RepID=A0A6A6RHI5_9PLEO|nr:hypothetical protein P280DRAFT_413500 [Massarina eburnea CBS 473.64]